MKKLFMLIFLMICFKSYSQIPLVNSSTPISSSLTNTIIESVNSYKSTINSGNHWGNLGGTGYKSNFNIASFGTSINDSNGNNYFHIKLNIRPSTQSEMYFFQLKGFNYGPTVPINIIFTGYSYNGSIVSKGYIDPSSYFGLAQYISSDGYVVLRVHASNSYFMSFIVNTVNVGNGRLYNKEDILSIVQNTGSNI